MPLTALVKGPNFTVLPRRQCQISFLIEGNDVELVRINLLFEGVEAFKCTYEIGCTAEMYNTAFGKLVNLGATPWLNQLLKTRDHRIQPVKELQHLMICFDLGPCFEFICEGFTESSAIANEVVALPLGE